MAILRGVLLVLPITPIHHLQLARPHSTFHPSIHPPTYPATYELMHHSHFVSSQFVVGLWKAAIMAPKRKGRPSKRDAPAFKTRCPFWASQSGPRPDLAQSDDLSTNCSNERARFPQGAARPFLGPPIRSSAQIWLKSDDLSTNCSNERARFPRGAARPFWAPQSDPRPDLAQK